MSRVQQIKSGTAPAAPPVRVDLLRSSDRETQQTVLSTDSPLHRISSEHSNTSSETNAFATGHCRRYSSTDSTAEPSTRKPSERPLTTTSTDPTDEGPNDRDGKSPQEDDDGYFADCSMLSTCKSDYSDEYSDSDSECVYDERDCVSESEAQITSFYYFPATSVRDHLTPLDAAHANPSARRRNACPLNTLDCPVEFCLIYMFAN